MRNQEWYTALPQLHSLDFCEFVFCLFSGDSMDGEATLRVIDETKVLSCLLDGNNVHEASWVGGVGADFSVNFYQTLHDNGLGFAAVESILQTVEFYSVSRHLL